MDSLLLAASVFAVFVAGHLAIYGLFAFSRAAGATPIGLGSLRHAVGFVVAEATMLTLALESGALRLAPFSLTKTVLALSASVVWWELWFYLGHRGLHSPVLYRFHRAHHEELRVHRSLAFGVVETAFLSSGFYLPLALASHAFAAVSVPTLVIALGGAYVLNVLSHLEGDTLSEGMERSALRHVFNAPRYHARHHRDGCVNFGLNAPWFDRMFGTERARGIAAR